MSKNTIIGIVIGGAVILLLVLFLASPAPEVKEPLPAEPVVPEEFTTPEEPVIPEEPAIPEAILELTEEELLRLESIFTEFMETLPPETSIEVLQGLEEKLMLLTADELRELTVEKIQEIFAEMQEAE